VHRLLDAEAPDYLKKPISIPHQVKSTIEPVGFIAPTLDGRITHFYEWRDAGYFSAKQVRGSMYQAEGFVQGIYYGFDLENLYFRIDPVASNRNHAEGLQFALQILSPAESRIVFPLHFSEGDRQSFDYFQGPGGEAPAVKNFSTIHLGQIIELSLPFREIPSRPKEKLDFFLRVQKGRIEVERYPRTGYLSLIVPDADYEQAMWQV
jgi:hypothetical protein